MEEIIKKLDKKFKILNYEYIDENLVITVTRTNKSDICPCCGKKSNNVHSRYFRTIKDLPIQENKVILKIKAKVFFCKNPKKFSTKLFSIPHTPSVIKLYIIFYNSK